MGAGIALARGLPARATPVAAPARVLYVDHSSHLAGAELILLDLVRDTPGASVFLFEDGDLRTALDACATPSVVSLRAADFSRVKRDRSLARALPLAGRMAGVVAELARAARSADIVYANSQKAFVLAAPAAALARRPLVWHLHDILTPAHFAGGQRRLVIGLANRLAARVIVPSDSAGTAFIAAGGDPARLRVVPNGVTLPVEPLDRASLRAELGLPASGAPNGYLLGVFSRLAPWKGQHVAVRALAAIPGATLVIAGDALFGEDAYAASLRDAAVAAGLSGRVRFLGHRRDVPRLMRAVDVMVHPTIDAEPFGRTVVEAMLCRTPIVATATGAVPDILDAGSCGMLVQPGDPEALAEAVARLRAEPDAAAARVGRAGRRAVEMFGAERMREGVAQVLAGVSGKRA